MKTRDFKITDELKEKIIPGRSANRDNMTYKAAQVLVYLGIWNQDETTFSKNAGFENNANSFTYSANVGDVLFSRVKQPPERFNEHDERYKDRQNKAKKQFDTLEEYIDIWNHSSPEQQEKIKSYFEEPDTEKKEEKKNADQEILKIWSKLRGKNKFDYIKSGITEDEIRKKVNDEYIIWRTCNETADGKDYICSSSRMGWSELRNCFEEFFINKYWSGPEAYQDEDMKTVIGKLKDLCGGRNDFEDIITRIENIYNELISNHGTISGGTGDMSSITEIIENSIKKRI